MVRQTVPDGYYPVSKVVFSQVIVTVMLNQFIFITSSPNYVAIYHQNAVKSSGRLRPRPYFSCLLHAFVPPLPRADTDRRWWWWRRWNKVETRPPTCTIQCQQLTTSICDRAQRSPIPPRWYSYNYYTVIILTGPVSLLQQRRPLTFDTRFSVSVLWPVTGSLHAYYVLT